jgi:hypothetical protein
MMRRITVNAGRRGTKKNPSLKEEKVYKHFSGNVLRIET